MNVLHVHSGNLFGGVETFLLTLARCRHLAPAMEMSVALCFEGDVAGRLRSSGISPAMLGEVRLRRPDKIRRARQALRSLLARRTVDVVVCHQAWPCAIFGPVVKAAGIPLVSWVHMAHSGDHWLDRLASRVEPDCYICNSRYTASTLPPTSARIEVLYAPVEPPAARPHQRHEPIVIIQVSRLEPWKGQSVLIEALSRLRDVPAWECWMVGGAQRPAEAEYLDALRREAERLHLQERIKFLGQRSDVADLLASADVFCQPNVEPEAFGISFVEALHAGLPVVTSAMGGAIEIVDDTCGVLVPPRDSSALSEALGRLLRDPEERDRLGRSGPARARSVSEPQRQMTAIAELFDSVTAHRAATHPS